MGVRDALRRLLPRYEPEDDRQEAAEKRTERVIAEYREAAEVVGKAGERVIDEVRRDDAQ